MESNNVSNTPYVTHTYPYVKFVDDKGNLRQPLLDLYSLEIVPSLDGIVGFSLDQDDPNYAVLLNRLDTDLLGAVVTETGMWNIENAELIYNCGEDHRWFLDFRGRVTYVPTPGPSSSERYVVVE